MLSKVRTLAGRGAGFLGVRGFADGFIGGPALEVDAGVRMPRSHPLP